MKVSLPTKVVNDIGFTTTGGVQKGFRPILTRIIDGHIRPGRFGRLALFRRTGGADHKRAQRFAPLTQNLPDPARRCVEQIISPAFTACVLRNKYCAVRHTKNQ